MMRTAQEFIGPWTLQRTVRDRLNGQHGTLSGQVHFSGRGDGQLIYNETGVLTLENGTTLEAARQYNWKFTKEAVIVTFDDGRPFHQFVPLNHAAGTDHPCGEDFYTVRYDFTAWPQWIAVWTVKGPRKDYVSTSTYRRC